jgi:hypothetical protein
MEKNIVEETEVPHEAMNDYEFAPLDYADAFCVRLSEGSDLSMTELAYNIFGKVELYPVYVRFLLWLRDFLVKPLGLHTADELDEIEDKSEWLGFFRIYQCSENEIILGADDKHLDLRVSFLRTVSDNKTFLTVSTFVRLNNLLGKIYFGVIKYFHRIIVPDTMRNSIRNMRRSGT